jgi:hypothetical protein
MKMNRQVGILIVMLLTACTNSIAQSDWYNGRQPIVVAEEGIRHISIAGNIDVVLRPAKPGNISVKSEPRFARQLRVIVSKDELLIEPQKPLPATERLVVYIWANDLETLRLSGRAFLTSIGVLDFANLSVHIKDQARIALQTNGRVRVKAPEEHRLVKQENYFSVFSEEQL